MHNQSPYFAYKKLINALGYIQSGQLNIAQITWYYNQEISPLCASIPHDDLLQSLLQATGEQLQNPAFIQSQIDVLTKAIQSFSIEQVDMLFVLTAPFDESARTGDGQYALSLVEGFSKHSDIQCVWMKEASNKDATVSYQIPKSHLWEPIPENTIPSVYALQPVANGKMVITGYKVFDEIEYQWACDKIKNQVTILTPKIITNSKGELLLLAFIQRNQLVFLSQDEVWEAIGYLHHYFSVYPETSALGNPSKLLELLYNQFLAPYKEEVLETCIKTLVGLIEAPSFDFIDHEPTRLATIKPAHTMNVLFSAAYKAAVEDADRKEVINSIMASIRKIGEGKKCAIDLHIRPPDTGIFITDEDIKQFKKMGLLVNLTIHEYKQNYTRPFLQQLTHHMLMRADTVLFFNEKDRHNAVMAAKRGSMDSVREGIWPLNKSYDLDHKASLTVAAQLLSGKENQSIESVLNKPANILCFGTIRSGKGFKIAMEVAQKINDRKQKGELEEFTSTVIVAGDPQDTALVETLFKERFGASALEQYIQSYPYDFRDSDSDASEKKVDYWNIALGVLDALSCSITSETTLNNPYFDIVIRPDSNALSQLKDRCKYVIRLDDMGMRNNGSGIISVLNTGIVFAKWGMVTDKEYLKKGLYADAVILSEHKYGKSNKKINFPNCPDHPRNFKEFQLYNRATGFNAKKGIESSYKREEKFWDSGDILAYILSREQDQREHADNISQSKNYVTVFMAQILLATRFTLENSVLSLTRALASNTPKILTSGYELESPTLLSNSFFTSKTEDKGSASQSLPGKTNSFS